MLAMADPDLDDGPRTAKSATRTCAVMRQSRPIDELIRFVVSPAGEVVPDLKRKLPGRGLWLTASRQTVAEAVRKHHFSKGFKRDVQAKSTLAEDTERLLERGAIDALAMAAKAGQVVAGFSKVEGALGQHQVRALVHASDGAPDGIRKLNALAEKTAGSAESAAIPVISSLTSEQLDLALGRSNVIHAALLVGPASKTFLSRCQMLVRYRLADDDKTQNDKTAGRAANTSWTRPVRTRTT